MSMIEAPSRPSHQQSLAADRADAPGPDPSRRGMIRQLSGIAAMWGAAAAATSRPARAADVSADADPGGLLVKLIDRITFGYTDAEFALATSLGYEGYLEYHLNHLAIDDSALNGQLAPFTTLTMTPHQLYDLPSGQVATQLIEAAIYRAMFSRRQLFERVVEFWTDHFNIDINNGDDRYLKTVDDRDVIRAHALGTFPALLDASAHSPAMLLYLDNNVSRFNSINENYARELMELHTVGVDGGYTQQDVIEVARCFTGWGLFPRSSDPLVTNEGTFRFLAGQHDPNPKVVLGQPINLGGINDGLAVLNLLSTHPNTARFISKKLCAHFLGYEVPQSIVNEVAATYTATGGDIKAMLRVVLRPNHLHDALPKYKRPFHQYISALRAVGATLTSTSGVRSNLSTAGHLPFNWSPPDGYPDTLEYWIGLVLPRWNFGASLMNGTTGSVSGASVPDEAFFAGATTADQAADRINERLFAGRLPIGERNRIRDYMLPNPTNRTRRREGLGLAIGAPAFQWH